MLRVSKLGLGKLDWNNFSPAASYMYHVIMIFDSGFSLLVRPGVLETMPIGPIPYPRPCQASLLSFSNIVVPAERYSQGEQESVNTISPKICCYTRTPSPRGGLQLTSKTGIKIVCLFLSL